MRTTLDIDDALMQEALSASGAKTEKDAVEAGLRLLVNMRNQVALRDLWGIAEWEGDLEQSRLSRFENREW